MTTARNGRMLTLVKVFIESQRSRSMLTIIGSTSLLLFATQRSLHEEEKHPYLSTGSPKRT